MHYGLQMLDCGIITAEALIEAIRYQQSKRPQIGELAVRRGKMTMHQVFEVLKRQADENRPFGEIARKMRFLTKRQLADLLLLQSELTPSISDALEVTSTLSSVSS